MKKMKFTEITSALRAFARNSFAVAEALALVATPRRVMVNYCYDVLDAKWAEFRTMQREACSA